jgi:HEAT repeat protein
MIPMTSQKYHNCIRPPLILLTLALSGCGNPTGRPDEGKTISELIAMLDAADPHTQAQGALGLSQQGPAALPALTHLTERLQSPALAVGKIGPEACPAVPTLQSLLRDEEWPVRRQAALALGDIGPPAQPALDDLKRLDRDPHAAVRQAATTARKRIAPR